MSGPPSSDEASLTIRPLRATRYSAARRDNGVPFDDEVTLADLCSRLTIADAIVKGKARCQRL
jgi:hypothetical protein